MSKRELKKYLSELSQEQLAEQIIDLYDKFKDVKSYYDFAFNPKEDKLLEEAKFKIGKEYFPTTRRKAKLRRSVAQKIIRQYKQLGVDPNLIADIMLYNIEVAQTYSMDKPPKQDSFYLSLHKSFKEATDFMMEHGIYSDFEYRIQQIIDQAWAQNWINKGAFE
ncbi:hypothetical protein EMN47_12050 [Prolixibacteraceae bacterium JC049]|nr:hypothetical protein [Prolixibacteraceae bacterium JC049]